MKNPGRDRSDMRTEYFDPDRYKAGERQTWDAVAAGWNRWRTTFEPVTQTLSDPLTPIHHQNSK